MKKALVTGGCGFIGSNIVSKLLNKGYKVVVLDNLSTGYADNIKGLNVELIKGDILEKELLLHVSKNVDYIFHLAACVGNLKSLNDPIFDSTVNINGTLNVLEAGRQNSVRKVVYSSSAAIYGELLYQPIDEKHPIEPESPYGVSKLAGEKHCLWFSKHYNLNVACLRYFNVYGINQISDPYGNVIPKWVNLILNNKPITIYGDGTQTRDFINVSDVAEANILAAENEGTRGYFNIATGSSITILELAGLLKKIFDQDIEIIFEDFRAGEVKHCRAEISKAKSSFQFNPKTEFELGLQEYVNWAKQK